ncbi:ArsR family transcriptional regulator [Clostridium sp.]
MKKECLHDLAKELDISCSAIYKQLYRLYEAKLISNSERPSRDILF